MEALTKKGYDVNYSWGVGVHSHSMGGAMLAGNDAVALARPAGVPRPARSVHSETLELLT